MVHQANHHHHLDHQEDKKLNWIGVPLEIQEMDYHHKEKDQIEHQENKNQNLIGILLETLKLNYLLEKERPQRENPDGTPRENSTRQTPRKQEPEFDWGAARNTKTSLPPRERLNRTGSNSGKNQLNLISIGKEAKVYHHVMFQDQVVTEKMLKR